MGLGLISSLTSHAQTSPFSWEQCSGTAKAVGCGLTFYVDQCRARFELRWPELAIPGTSEWNRDKRNWCTLSWYRGEKRIQTHKQTAKGCVRIFQLFSDAVRNFPEVPMQQSLCSLASPSEGLLVVSESKNKKANMVPHVGRCQVETSKSRSPIQLNCPLVDDRTEVWLNELGRQAKITVRFYNPGDQGPLSTPPPNRVLR